MHLRIALAGAARARSETEIGADGAALVEASRVLEGEHVGERSECADAMDLSQRCGLGVLSRELIDGAVVEVNLVGERSE